MSANPMLNEPAIDVCDACGGDGGWDEVATAYGHTRWYRCEHCEGTGLVLHSADEAGEDWGGDDE